MSDTPTLDAADPAATPTPDDALPSPVDLVTSTLSVFMDNILPMLMLGLGQMVVALVAVIVLIPLGSGCMIGLWALLGAGGGVIDWVLDAGGQITASVTGLSFLISYFLAIGFALIVLTIVSSPFAGSMLRSMDAHLAGESEATFQGVFDTALQQPVKDIAANVLLMVLVLIGLPFCYVGALIPAFFLMWMTMASELDGLPLGQAIGRSLRAVRERPGWCLGVYALGVVFAMLAGYVPVLGQVAMVMFMMRAYRVIFPREAAA